MKAGNIYKFEMSDELYLNEVSAKKYLLEST